jgi:uncharacterized protein (TIGR03066 family)
MNARHILPLVFIALPFAIAGDLPQAPPPHVKKTTAELLVGKWDTVTFLGKPVKRGNKVVLEFTAQGKFAFTTITPRLPLQVGTGVYRVVGNTIHFTSDATDEPSRSWEITIESISESELALAAGPPADVQRSTCKRLAGQK